MKKKHVKEIEAVLNSFIRNWNPDWDNIDNFEETTNELIPRLKKYAKKDDNLWNFVLRLLDILEDAIRKGKMLKQHKNMVFSYLEHVKWYDEEDLFDVYDIVDRVAVYNRLL